MSRSDKEYKVVCRGSLLSRAQAEYFVDKLKLIEPKSKFTIVVKDTAGDRDQQKLLQDMDGKDFFTKEIQDFLIDGHADFAVHSLKDVSSELFFKNNDYAVISREDPRDVAIFNDDVLHSIGKGIKLRLGTSSPRRALMATRFLKQSLPTINKRQPAIEAQPIRGNVDTRLQKLHTGQYDGIILAIAGLNRLLNYPDAREIVSRLLRNKRIMVLPLIECPPPPGQGVIVAETRPDNDGARELLRKVDNATLREDTRKERMMAAKYGAGCHQQFGVVHVSTPDISFTYGAGTGSDGMAFSRYDPYPVLNATGKNIFSAGDHMGSFFRYEFPSLQSESLGTPAVLVASQHALHSEGTTSELGGKRIWTAGTKTWRHLAEKGLWVEGCADALGLEFIAPWLSGPLIGLSRNDLTILTDADSAVEWRTDGWTSRATYSVKVERSKALAETIAAADIVFWTSFRQFAAYRDVIKPDVTHCCSTGRTATLFREAGITPVVFAGIKGFNEWRRQIHNTATKDA
jgi:hydroxymethylbilane synthase